MAAASRTELLLDIPTPIFERCALALPVIRALVDQSSISQRDYEEAAKKLAVSTSTVRRLVIKLQDDPEQSIRALLPQKTGRRRGYSRLDPRVEAIIEHSIKSHYLVRTPPSLKKLSAIVNAACHKHQLKKPSVKAVRRRISRLPKGLVEAKQKGAKQANQKFQARPGAFKAEGAYSVLQIDHAKCDLAIVDRAQRLAIGRPWITLAIDIASRCIVGYYITLEEPSTLSSALCIVNSVLSKESHLAERGLHFDWPCFGIPDSIHTDNGSDFHSSTLARALTAYDIEHIFRPPGKPHFGGHIERLIGTFMREMHILPGTTFSNIQEKADYDSEARSAMTLDELDKWICAQINQYHHSIHGSLGTTPLDAWISELSKRRRPLRFVKDTNRFRVDFLPVEFRSVTREGLRLNNIRYWHSSFAPILQYESRRVPVHFDPRDLSQVYVQLNGGEIIEAKYADTTHPAITYWEMKIAREELRKRSDGELHEQQIFDMIELKRKIVQDSTATTKKARKRVETTNNALSNAHWPIPTLARDAEIPSPIKSDTLPDLAAPTLYDVEDWS